MADLQPPDSVRAIRWHADHMSLLDQRRLPGEVRWLRIEDLAGATAAIRDMVVRGAPAIGITAAYAAVLGARQALREDPGAWRALLGERLAALEVARPTAVNLAWAVQRVRAELARADVQVGDLERLAVRIHEEDVQANHRMGALGAALLTGAGGVLTHCNTGSLATGGYGTALGVVRSAWAAGHIREVFADETRPWLQGARLTAWELLQDGLPVSLLVEGAAAWLMRQGRVRWVVVGADRVAANGDVANKIGTYGLAISARHHGVKFMVVAPSSTVDMRMARGADIPIEERPGEELLQVGTQRLAAAGASAWNPVFDVTPAALIDALVTERGVLERPGVAGLRELMDGAL